MNYDKEKNYFQIDTKSHEHKVRRKIPKQTGKKNLLGCGQAPTSCTRASEVCLKLRPLLAISRFKGLPSLL